MELRTITETAAELKTSMATVRGIVRARKIPTIPVPRSPNSKGLTLKAVAEVRRALYGNLPAKRQQAAL